MHVDYFGGDYDLSDDATTVVVVVTVAMVTVTDGQMVPTLAARDVMRSAPPGRHEVR